MEKFTQPKQKENILLKMIEESVNISVLDPNKLNDDLKIDGKEQLIEKFEEYLDNYLKESKERIIKNLKGKSLNFVNEKYLDKNIKDLKHYLRKFKSW